MKIAVSFKENEKDIFEYVDKQLSHSVYIKQLILDDMNKNKKTTDTISNKPDKKNITGFEFGT